MKLNKIILPVMACALTLSGCYDEKMEWGKPDGHGDVNISDIPLALKEKLANYDYIKAYAKQYAPHMTIGLGLGADQYISDPQYKQVADDNFQLFTTGNAMKHQAVVKSDGSLDFTTIDAFLQAVPTDIKIYGHNFLWHTQQNQNYLKSLIAPTMKVESSGGVANILSGDATDFNGGTTGGWGSWGSNKDSQTIEEGAGSDGTPCMVLKNLGDGNAWEAQCGYTLSDFLQVGKTYMIKFKAKSTSGAGYLQFQYQNGTTYGSQGGYNDFNIGIDWNDFEYEFTPDYEDINRIILNFGKVGATYYIDDIQFGLKVEDPMTNVLSGDNSDFEGGTKGSWGSWGNNSTTSVSASGEGYNSNYCIVLVNPTDGSDYYAAQLAYTFDDPLKVGETYVIQFYAKTSLTGAGVQFATQNSNDYSGEGYHAIPLSSEWVLCEHEYTCSKEGINRILINFGKNAATFYLDNIKFGVKKATARALTRGTSITYVPKSAEEKKAALLSAMEAWIKGMAQHPGMERVTEWDVINEPIGDNSKWRGFDNTFMDGDSAPVENEESGLTLNWGNEAGNGHFYWGYYIGKEYATKAFEYARKYCSTGTKLYVNDYNLESSPNKLAALIDFVQYIEDNGQEVDGIGTQMHVSSSITKDQVDAMFKTMAATGKLIRVTELDVQVGTTTPSAEQLATQAEVYQMIFDSYRINVPQAQQSGITIWTLTDSKKEHEYWLPNDAPNLFDANYERKHAYKGVCDGIAGKDISEDFSGDDWKNAYETEGEETPAE
ncbi:endo-1,4-beta-xylanase [Bacteroides cellulosilyticus]|uniref:endo-1,4-beta-xylanase n=1 Tax=Bacteroides cellulosilyticus TaxID=246787 RepID=UPI001C375624|nr:endo-1,4-beta-xylanase [Bacteroides cellulosilyticus]MBV3639099.1 endo-1,4-beta-xylanase [Bacteroides cellulosilyticus]MBV3664825.1 endo-1,4-beta-xylanase [Bacteroides cellulosilyticus]MBV3687694.1 endo-1,4-beta-xylanase [Bacteroides cellulosilyticus]MBV3695938.1 endo-1,4-beta-xylanase [Bacteroides cellulosilyticus]MBV3709961.1 endo-1,4-beta-xylanase [Bacteroides cellulosilyticus]